MAIITGTPGGEFLFGDQEDDEIKGRDGDDSLFGRGGEDRIFGNDGFDNLYGGKGDDCLYGGRQNDNLYGAGGNDELHGDSGRNTAKLSDLGSDNLNGGNGNDTLFQGDGNDVLSGGDGRDAFFFKWSDPMIALAAGTGRAFASLTDFSAEDDRLLFDAAGVGNDSNGANFIGAGGRAESFFEGAAAASDGEAVMVLTDQGFASGLEAVAAAQNEALGDFVLYFNTTVGVASLLFVDGTDAAHSIARFTNINSLAELRDMNFSAGDFIFV